MADLITDERVQKAIDYLVNTDESAAKAKSYMLGLEKQEKTILATEQLKVTGTVQAKEDAARTSEAYLQWQKYYKDSVYEFEILRNRRNTAELIVECWRSVNANKRKGNI